jgi:ABC-type dipeptide/oligopeptide/nickel transport system ATPase component
MAQTTFGNDADRALKDKKQQTDKQDETPFTSFSPSSSDMDREEEVDRRDVIVCFGWEQSDVFWRVKEESTISMDHIYLDIKPNLTNILDNFSTDTHFCRRMGVNHSLTLLVYGRSGTGKMSLAKAISHYMNRSIVCVNARNMKGLEHALMRSICATAYHRSLGFENIIQETGDEMCSCKKCRDENPSSHNYDGRHKKNKKSDTFYPFFKCDCSHADLPCNRFVFVVYGLDKQTSYNQRLLELTSTMMDMPGRIMIFITGEDLVSLNPTFTRPGRVDIVILTREMNKEHVACLHEKWFGRPLPMEVYKKMRENVFTIAEINNLFRSNNREHIHKILAEG